MKKIHSIILASAAVLVMPLAVTSKAQTALHAGTPIAAPAAAAPEKPAAKAVVKTRRVAAKGKRKAKAARKAAVQQK